MSKKKGWISLYRQFLEWEWYDCPNIKIIFLHCLLTANHKDKKWRDIIIKRGQLVTSYEKLAAANGITSQQVRTVLEKLQSTDEVSCFTNNQYTLITIKKYDEYQLNDRQDTEDNPDNKRNGGQITSENQLVSSDCRIMPDPDNKQKAGQRVGQITTNNNINKERYINISLSGKNITKREREILISFIKKLEPKVKNVNAYIRKLVENGDYLTILKAEKSKIQRKKVKEDIPPPAPPPKEDEELTNKIRDESRARVEGYFKVGVPQAPQNDVFSS